MPQYEPEGWLKKHQLQIFSDCRQRNNIEQVISLRAYLRDDRSGTSAK
jgi:hypothetical protein